MFVVVGVGRPARDGEDHAGRVDQAGGQAERGRRALGWLAALGLPARLVDATGVVLTVAGWPADTHDDEHALPNGND